MATLREMTALKELNDALAPHGWVYVPGGSPKAHRLHPLTGAKMFAAGGIGDYRIEDAAGNTIGRTSTRKRKRPTILADVVGQVAAIMTDHVAATTVSDEHSEEAE